MDKFTNELTPAQAERLAILAEECAEVIVIVGKILRHGYESFDPTKSELLGRPTNKDLLAYEIGDLMWIKHLMSQCGDYVGETAAARFHSGDQRKAQWLHHQTLKVGRR